MMDQNAARHYLMALAGYAEAGLMALQRDDERGPILLRSAARGAQVVLDKLDGLLLDEDEGK